MRVADDTSTNRVLRVLAAERARDLCQRLRLPVLVHDLGWRSTEIEVQITRRADGSIAPTRVLMGPAALDLMMLNDDGVHARCERYSQVVGQLRELARLLAEFERTSRAALRPGSPLAYARAVLATLDDLVARRERMTMRNGAVRLATLDLEIAFFTRYYAWLAPIVESVTGSAPISMPSRRRRGRRRRHDRGRDRRLESAS